MPCLYRGSFIGVRSGIAMHVEALSLVSNVVLHTCVQRFLCWCESEVGLHRGPFIGARSGIAMHVEAHLFLSEVLLPCV